MIEFGGRIYCIDVEAFDSLISPELDGNKRVETHKKTYLDGEGKVISVEINEIISEKVREVNAAKYDLFRTMIDVVLDDSGEDELDDTLGADRGLEKTSLSFKIAFNTLYDNGILIEKE